jgi:hypothetical protein
MNRAEFKVALSAAVDEVIDTERELTDEDEDALNDYFGDVALNVFQAESTDADDKQTE